MRIQMKKSIAVFSLVALLAVVVPATANAQSWGSRRNSNTRTAVTIIGGTAAGAVIGGLLGGKKGALIGAGVGAGGTTIYEVARRRNNNRNDDRYYDDYRYSNRNDNRFRDNRFRGRSCDRD